MLDRLSLRTRLVLGVIVLAAVGLAVANVVTYTSLRSFLFDRTDAALARSSERLAHSVFDHGECGGRGGRPPPGSVSGDYIEARDAGGTTVCGVQVAPPDGTAPPPPDLPSDLEAQADGDGGRTFTVASDGGSERYRVHLAVDPGSGGMLIVARPIADIDATLRRLLLIELLVTALVLAAIAALGLWVVRLGLRPLDAIGATASAIASGNLAQRIERAEPRTEVGRLGLALNGMLARIEDSFHAQQASERRLRRFVADDGPGLAAGEAARVFERFYRADESRARATGGVGLGLSVVAAVAAAHGGTATAASKLGHGATFTVTLPIAASENGDAPAGDETLACAAKAADG